MSVHVGRRCFVVSLSILTHSTKHSNSDIWRDFPALVKPFLALVFLTPQQGCYTSVQASLDPNPTHLYYQPYWMPFHNNTVPFPAWEMLGCFRGSVPVEPRLPQDPTVLSRALWEACEEVCADR